MASVLGLRGARGEREHDAAPYPHGDNRPDADYALYSKALWHEQDSAMEPLHRVWIQNLLFLSNKHWWEERLGSWQPKKMAAWRARPVSNYCLAFFRTQLAKVTKNRPAWSVVAASTDAEDLQAAELADEVLQAKWTELRLSRIIRRACAWTIATGNAFLYPFWNNRTGKLIPNTVKIDIPVIGDDGVQEVDEDGEPKTEEVDCPCDKNGQPLVTPGGKPDWDNEKMHWVDEGDIGVAVYSGFQVRVNPDAETEEDLTWVILADVATLRELEQHEEYGKHMDAIHGEDVGPLEGLDRILASAAGDPRSQTSSGDSRDNDLPKTLILHYHEKQTPEYPEGRYWVTAGDAVLVEPQGLPDGVWPPIVHLQDLPGLGSYYSPSTFEAIVGLNKQYNELNATVEEHHNLMAKGKWLIPKGAGIPKGSITNEGGEVIEFYPGFKPEQADLKPLPAAVYQERERIKYDFETVGGQHKISQGRPPPGITAGVSLMALQEADDSDIGPFLSMLEEGIAELGAAELQIIRKRYTDERLIYAVGHDKRYQVKSFKASQLDGAIDVVPQTGSAFPWSKSAQQSMLLDLVQRIPALFTNAETGQLDTGKIARLLPVGGLGGAQESEDVDVNEALREQDMFQSYDPLEGGELPRVEEWQNHLVHYAQHVRVLKREGFSQWPPEAQELYLAHVQETKAKIDEMRQAAMAEQMAAQNPGGAAPPGAQAAPEQGAPEEGPVQEGPIAEAMTAPALTMEAILDMDPQELAQVMSQLAPEDVANLPADVQAVLPPGYVEELMGGMAPEETLVQ